ncbi:DUF555 domain-containing protein [Haloquadratum walsbyi]|jgi:Uncharacterized protein conserved in archaea|uniref:UPF0212 protein J07HQW2_01205 n=1 Tax=Haloquadratum walsbyi J07HQW2 TaxID=1238425 RepID=U1NDF7_9EURY|nr:DUF555 domain-containing protein [Haloquadratum walsbyi]ERG94763.1 MAG: uncharacterized protein conserved in archaea [Haloquadratum walsbyi J07HQW2]
MDCSVVVEAAVPVYDVESADEAVRIAISKTGKMLNPDLSYVEISMGSRSSPSGEELPSAFVAADEALVALELEMTVFNVERTEHASRIARKEIGQRLENIPLKILHVSPMADEEKENENEKETTETESESETDISSDESTGNVSDDSDDDNLIPEFDELVEDS